MEKKQNWYVNKKKYHFIYKTTCKVNGKYYIGMHSTDKLDDGYIGSGTRLWHSIKKHGKENFSIEILEFLPDRESLRLRERKIVNEDLLKDSQCMNLTCGGDGGWFYANLKLTPEIRTKAGKLGGGKKFTQMWKTNPTQIESFRNLAIQKAATVDSINKRKETFLKIEHQQGEKNSQYGTCWITNGSNSKKIKLSELHNLDAGWHRGRAKVNRLCG